MKLRKTARGVLKRLRPKQTIIDPANAPKASETRYNVVLSSPDAQESEEETTRLPGQLQRAAAGTSASILGKRGRLSNNMGHPNISIHEDQDDLLHETRRPQNVKVNEMEHILSQDEESVEGSYSEDSEESDDEVDESVIEDMRKLEESFKGISAKYRLINRIGEGTFSTVYKAEQLQQDDDPDQENDEPEDESDTQGPPSKRRKTNTAAGTHTRLRRRPQIVALKKIYVTSSPHRILNELELLHELRESPYICPLLTAFRHLDQVVAVLPYFRHLDFRLYYRDFLVNDMRHYFRSLFNALWHVHKAGILHRDIKPTNFLYDHSKRQGVLVDFGLAERQGTDWQPCLCCEARDKRKDKFLNSFAVQILQTQPDLVSTGYPKSDSRPSRRANRAGTRGFRAPEVLLKCTSQTTKIDIWSAGVILLTLLARRFPFFNSADDVDAMIEMASIFGRKKMQAVAAMHGQLFETNIETIGERGFTLEKIILWASCREKEHDALRAGEAQAVSFLSGLLELDAGKRWNAKEALQHAFFTAPIEDEDERAEREAQEAAEQAERMRR
ncbi:cell division control protein 7 [Exophiala viscosa]|uniref:non-specific serine/threonine protein kinase n=1 Tax=Exophiala viscosa TaxID=2486360 RepID=A0AAN6I9J8_9EURO|nr:cell division control protein 7 [Exophiala viscosa]